MSDPLPSRNPSADPLDRLLGLSPLPEPDAWFTARTLARCRTAPAAWRFSPGALLRRRWMPIGALAICLLGFGGQQAHRNATLRVHHQNQAQEAFEVVAAVDDSSDSSWQDTSL